MLKLKQGIVKRTLRLDRKTFFPGQQISATEETIQKLVDSGSVDAIEEKEVLATPEVKPVKKRATRRKKATPSNEETK